MVTAFLIFGGCGTVAVAVDVNSIMIDYFIGGYLAIEPNEHFRLFAGAGLYARAGLDIFLTKQFGFTAGARATKTSLNIENDTGKFNIEGYQYYLGIAFRF